MHRITCSVGGLWRLLFIVILIHLEVVFGVIIRARLAHRIPIFRLLGIGAFLILDLDTIVIAIFYEVFIEERSFLKPSIDQNISV